MEEVTTLAQLNALDQDAIVEGYLHGLHGTPNHTRQDQAYWHGYFNAHSDRNGPPTPGQQQLAREVVNAMRCGCRAPA
ncbi:hypothetical protein [Rhodoferax sp. GW822-FHT02A01]|uniref:hypothetical protein n=1 Tax=Rhodoferax sp. GW822-FHT02A01 TaxID=3141537 RepID=UPI00315D68E3